MAKETSPRPLDTTILHKKTPRFSWHERFCKLRNSTIRDNFSPGAWGGLQTVQEAQKKQPPGPKIHYLVFLINRAGILENLGSNMGQKSVLNQLFKPFRAFGSVRNGFAMYFSSRLSLPKLRTASKWSQNPFVSP